MTAREEKNKAIREAGAATRLRHKGMSCKTFRCKINFNHLTASQRQALPMFFIESKRLYNYILGEAKDTGYFPKTGDYKNYYDISYYNKDKRKISYHIQYIGSSVISDIITSLHDSLKGLSITKRRGRKVGPLNFKSECNSVRLRQYGITHKIVGNNKILVQGLGRLRVRGLDQLKRYDNIEIANANLLYDGSDYFISLTCFVDKQETILNSKKDIVGIDLGCSDTIVLSDGTKMDVSIGESERLKGLQARLASQVKRSNNWYKTLRLIRKEYNRMTNRKNDAANKIVHELKSNYRTIVMQDDPISEWKEDPNLSRTIQHSILGRIKTRLKNYEGTVVLDQWFPTTIFCPSCGSTNKMPLSRRTYKCPCGYSQDRDIHAANNMIWFFEEYKRSVGTLDLKPRSVISYDSYKKLIEHRKPAGILACR